MRKCSVSSHRRDGAQGATMRINANRITCSWNLLVMTFLNKLKLTYIMTVITAVVAVVGKRKKKLKMMMGELNGIEAL
jgi:hypothetical protein